MEWWFKHPPLVQTLHISKLINTQSIRYHSEAVRKNSQRIVQSQGLIPFDSADFFQRLEIMV